MGKYKEKMIWHIVDCKLYMRKTLRGKLIDKFEYYDLRIMFEIISPKNPMGKYEEK